MEAFGRIPSGFATTINQTNGSQKTQIVDGSGNVISSTSNALNVNVSSYTNDDKIDSGNSSTTVLAGNASFTGAAFDSLGYNSIELLVYSDQNSTTGGVQIQFSSDNSNWDDASTYTFTAGNAAPNAGQVYASAIRARYYRVKYTNGGTNQTTFRLSALLKKTHPTGETIPMSDVPTALGSHGLLTKAAIVGKTTAGGGTFVDVKVNPSGAVTAAVTAADGDVFTRSNAASTFPMNPQPVSNTGWTFFYVAGGLTSTKQQIKGAAGTFGGWAWLYNPNTVATFIQIFNKASANVTVGSTTPDFVIVLPGVASASATGSAANSEIVMGIKMNTGITVAATTTETGSTGPASNIFVTFLYI